MAVDRRPPAWVLGCHLTAAYALRQQLSRVWSLNIPHPLSSRATRRPGTVAHRSQHEHIAASWSDWLWRRLNARPRKKFSALLAARDAACDPRRTFQSRIVSRFRSLLLLFGSTGAVRSGLRNRPLFRRARSRRPRSTRQRHPICTPMSMPTPTPTLPPTL